MWLEWLELLALGGLLWNMAKAHARLEALEDAVTEIKDRNSDE